MLYNLLKTLSTLFGFGVVKPTISLVRIKKGNRVGNTFKAQTEIAFKQLFEYIAGLIINNIQTKNSAKTSILFDFIFAFIYNNHIIFVMIL